MLTEVVVGNFTTCLRPNMPLQISRYIHPLSSNLNKYYYYTISKDMDESGRRMYLYSKNCMPQ